MTRSSFSISGTASLVNGGQDLMGLDVISVTGTAKVDLGSSFVKRRLIDIEFSATAIDTVTAYEIGFDVTTAQFVLFNPNGVDISPIGRQYSNSVAVSNTLIGFSNSKPFIGCEFFGSLALTVCNVTMPANYAQGAAIPNNVNFIVFCTLVFE